MLLSILTLRANMLCHSVSNLTRSWRQLDLAKMAWLLYQLVTQFVIHTLQATLPKFSGVQDQEEEEEIFYMFRPDNTSDHMQQGLMTLHHVISLQQ